jgi:ribosomal protein L40E
MKCPRCQHENPPQAKFCLECGARVALTCGKCRSELPAGAKFCLECGTPVVSQATAETRFTSPESYGRDGPGPGRPSPRPGVR